LRYRKLVTKKSRCYIIICGLWAAAVITFIAPLLTKPNWSYYRYNANQKMCGLHWEYPSFCIITTLFIPILSGSILIFTALRIRATLRRSDQMTNSQTRVNLFVTNPTSRQSNKIVGSRRTIKILIFRSVTYCTLVSPYVVIYMIQSFFSSFKPPAAVEFIVMWLANTNSAVNVFVYSATNTQFRRQCVLLASRICCSRSSLGKQPDLCRMIAFRPNITTAPPVIINMSSTNPQDPGTSEANILDVIVSSSRDDGGGSAADLLSEPTVDNLTQAVSVK